MDDNLGPITDEINVSEQISEKPLHKACDAPDFCSETNFDNNDILFGDRKRDIYDADNNSECDSDIGEEELCQHAYNISRKKVKNK